MLKTEEIVVFSLLVLIPLSNPNTIDRPKENKAKLVDQPDGLNSLDKQDSVCPAKILLIGGRYSVSVPAYKYMEIYNPDMPTSNHLVNVSMLIPRYGHISELLNDHTVITCGGNNASHEQMNSCEIFDLHTNKVTKGSNLTAYRTRAASAVLDGIPYVCGGFAWSNLQNCCLVATCERYQSGVWNKIASLSDVSSDFAMTALDGHIYATGTDNTDEGTKTVERYDPVSNKWSMTKPMLVARYAHSAAVFDKLLIVCGGYHTRHSCESYDPKTNAWAPFAKTINERDLFNLVTAGGHLYALGHVKVVETYDPKQRKWIAIKPTIFNREYASAVVISSCNV